LIENALKHRGLGKRQSKDFKMTAANKQHGMQKQNQVSDT
jgi:hypothetical protein